MAQEFVKGLYANFPSEKQKGFMVCGLSAKREELVDWLRGQTGEWVNMAVKISLNGEKLYVAVDHYQKKNEYQEPDRSEFDHADDMEGTVEIEHPDGSIEIDYPTEDINPNDIPF